MADSSRRSSLRVVTRQDERPGAERWVPEDAGVDELRAASDSCRGCELWQDATQVVFSAGRPGAPLMLVGEQPGDHEDRVGEPFVGPAGQVLEDALDAAGIGRRDIYLTNAVKHFRFEPRGTRRIHMKPTTAHVVACHPWLRAEVEAVRPRLIVTMGATAARAVLGRPVTIGEERGMPLALQGLAVDRALVTAHPSSLLRMRDAEERRAARRAFVADLRAAAELAGMR
ncbi:UdgX family uracil-DNA binding protein [Microbacterium sp.]|uniref:UdgX family uracil-DNA binding protein n=1 Tax=Microbacterium sp. TaxID=51671 RepID=UPI00356A0689